MHSAQRTIPTHGPFSLAESATLGFGRSAQQDVDGVMRLAFTVDGDHERTAGVAIRQQGDLLHLTMTTDADPDTVAAQVARILSVDVDGTGFEELALRDPVVGALRAAAPGLRPPQFHSPYEAAAWSIISARRSAVQGNVIRERLSAEHGTRFEVAGTQLHAFPTPSALARVTEVRSLPDLAIPRLHAVAEAATAGRLDVARLVVMDPEDAMADVRTIPGIGPFYSALVIVRACGLPDVLPLNEPRSRVTLEQLHGIADPLSDNEFAAMAEAWRPYRMWVLFLGRAAGGRISAPVAGGR